jgi:hypothetical protein
MKAEVSAEHAWLRRLVGEWTSEMAFINGAPQPAGTMAGIETVRALGDVWFLAEGRGQMPDGKLPCCNVQREDGSWSSFMTARYWRAR